MTIKRSSENQIWFSDDLLVYREPCLRLRCRAVFFLTLFFVFRAVEQFQQLFGFFRVFAAEDFGGFGFEQGGVAVQDDVFDGEQVVGVHGETAQPHAQQHPRVGGVACHFAAYGDAFFHAVGGADDVLQHFEDGGVAGLVEVADAVVAAVDRQDVLDQVVGADGDEIDKFEDAADG